MIGDVKMFISNNPRHVTCLQNTCLRRKQKTKTLSALSRNAKQKMTTINKTIEYRTLNLKYPRDISASTNK